MSNIQIYLNIILTASLLLLISLSFQLIYQTIKIFHIAQAGIIALAAYFAYTFSILLEFEMWLSILFAVLLSIIINVFIEMIIYNPLRKCNCQPYMVMIASLGVYIILQNIISLIWTDETKSFRTTDITVGNEFFGAYITDIQIITVCICVFLFLLTIFFIKSVSIGKHIQAISSNNILSNIFGINSKITIIWSFIISSILASIAGILSAFNTDMYPTMGFNLLLYGMVAMIIGGVGSYWGLIGGSLLVATAQHIGAYYIDSVWVDAITYIILILFLVWKPLGFSGKQLKKVNL